MKLLSIFLETVSYVNVAVNVYTIYYIIFYSSKYMNRYKWLLLDHQYIAFVARIAARVFTFPASEGLEKNGKLQIGILIKPLIFGPFGC